MKKTFQLAWGLIIRPKSTFGQVKEERPIKWVLIIFLISIFLNFILAFILGQIRAPGSRTGTPILIFKDLGEGLVFELIGSLCFLCLWLFLTNLFAVALKGETNFKNLFICSILLNGVMKIVISLVEFVLNIISFLSPTLLLSRLMARNLFQIVVYGWTIVLIYLMVGRIYNLNRAKTFLIFLIPILVIGAIFLLLFRLCWGSL